MAIISTIGRKHFKTRALLFLIVASLSIGAVTMVYPFLLMVGGSSKSSYDEAEFSVIPGFYRSAEQLYAKHTEGLFNEKSELMNMVYDSDTPSFRHIELPEKCNEKFASEWEEFLKTEKLPLYSYSIGYLYTPASGTKPKALRDFKKEMAKKYGKKIADVNKALGTDYITWNAFFILPDYYYDGTKMPTKDKLTEEVWAFKEKQPLHNRYYFSIEGFFKKLFLKSKYEKDIAEYNKKHGTNYKSYKDIHLPEAVPKGNKLERKDWLVFVRDTLNPLWIRFDAKALPLYQSFLKAKYKNIDSFNAAYHTKYSNFKDIPVIKEVPFKGALLGDFVDFIDGWKDPATKKIYKIPDDMLRIVSIDTMFREYLKKKYKTVTALNTAIGADFKSFTDVYPPQEDFHYNEFGKITGELKWEFATRNFVAVLDYLVFQGRGVFNTVVYCGLVVIIALLVNPLAAYALSRFKMPSTYKILLFLMLTMAFPPMVTQIPVFVMMKKLGLLNTFAALILPQMANGYSIFLLKGFFDSLPQELYESASLDGASEWTMFWVITMNLSKPILAVIALNAFTLAYSNFMFALLLCQDEKMWTLMVWIYQLQQMSGTGVVYASLIIAAVPTFIIFVFCQNIIMRGIVVPTEK
jgi:multiple sugar transport system permease protein